MLAETSYGMSACQLHMWEGMRFRASGDPGLSSKNVHVARLVSGHLDRLRLAEALRYLTEIHDVLRMRLSDSDQVPRLVVAASVQQPYAFVDLSVSPGNLDEVTRVSRTIVSALADQTFDLTAEPPWRCTVVRLATDRHIICLTLNSLLVDGSSALILMSQLGTAYAGRTITPPPASYAPYAGRTYPADADLFWSSEINAVGYHGVAADAPTGTDGPYTAAWRTYPIEFGDDELTITEGSGRTRHWTPYMVHAAAYCAALAKTFRRDTFVVGTSVYRADLKPTPTSVGCYLDFVYFLYRDAPDAEIDQRITRVRTAFMRGLQNLSLSRSIIAGNIFAGDISKVPPGTFFHDVWIRGAYGVSGPARQSMTFGDYSAEPVPRPPESGCRVLTTPYQVWLYSKKIMPSLYLTTADGNSVYVEANASAHSQELIHSLIATYRARLLETG